MIRSQSIIHIFKVIFFCQLIYKIKTVITLNSPGSSASEILPGYSFYKNIFFISTANKPYQDLDSYDKAVKVYQHESLSQYYIEKKGQLFIPDSLFVNMRLKFNKVISKSYFEFSNSQVEIIQVDVEMDIIKFSILESTCSSMMIIPSPVILEFERDEINNYRFIIKNTFFSSLKFFLDGYPEIIKNELYEIPMKDKENRNLKFIHFICPFFNSDEMKSLIKIGKMEENEDQSFTSIDYFEEDKSNNFIENMYKNEDIKKLSINNQIQNPETNPLIKLDFNDTQAYLLYAFNIPSNFSIKIESKSDFLVIREPNNSTHTIEKKGINEKLSYKVKENVLNEINYYFYIEKPEEKNIYVDIEKQGETSDFVKILQQNWKYFLLIFVFIILLILWRIIKLILKRIKEKKKIKDEIKKAEKKKDLEDQKRSRRITRLLENKSHKMGGIC